MRPQQLSDTRLRPRRGMLLAFTPASSQHLADIPAQVVYIWPRCRSGAYLVTLEYADAVRVGQAWIHHIDAFMDELYAPIAATSTGSVPAPQPSQRWRAQHVGAGFRTLLSAIVPLSLGLLGLVSFRTGDPYHNVFGFWPGFALWIMVGLGWVIPGAVLWTNLEPARDHELTAE